MTALEKLIRTASNDAAPHYRELAKEAQLQFDEMVSALQFYAECRNFSEYEGWNSFKMGEPPPPPELTDRGEVARNALEPFESYCTPTNSVDK